MLKKKNISSFPGQILKQLILSKQSLKKYSDINCFFSAVFNKIEIFMFLISPIFPRYKEVFFSRSILVYEILIPNIKQLTGQHRLNGLGE